MATIKAIESRSVHQIQSGQVIVDLSSVVKELVENSLDAGASSIEIRFKNQGLDSIEVQDNGKGIAPEDFETVALKHYTSKLSSYEDIDTLDTFGFRGEALSSLCALSKFHILTARAEDGAAGKRLDFEQSGKLKSASVAPAQKGTTVCVDDLFHNLPVRRKELEKNVKREYGKVLNYLYAYACISVGVRFMVSNTMPKGKRIPLFTTKNNPSTRENIINIFGAKTLSALVPLDLGFDMEPSTSIMSQVGGQHGSNEVRVEGHISKPVFGEGRQAPDRQMFFVNSRPCLLPQISKVINDVYRSFNVSQSPFVFANLIMNTNAYDVNVSPDKRTILLHDQVALLESLKSSLTELFETAEQTVPQTHLPSQSRSSHRVSSISQRAHSLDGSAQDDSETTPLGRIGRVESEASDSLRSNGRDVEASPSLIKNWATRGFSVRKESPDDPDRRRATDQAAAGNGLNGSFCKASDLLSSMEEDSAPRLPVHTDEEPNAAGPRVANGRKTADGDNSREQFSGREPTGLTNSNQPTIRSMSLLSHRSSPGPVQSAFDRMRPRHSPHQIAHITIGSEPTRTSIGSASSQKKRRIHIPNISRSSINSTESPLALRGNKERFAGLNNQHDNDSEDPTSDEHSESQSEHGDLSDAASSAGAADDTGEAMTSAQQTGSRRTKIDADKSLFVNEGDSDEEPIDEVAHRVDEDGRVARLILDAEETSIRPGHDHVKRATQSLKYNSNRKDSVLRLATTVLSAEEEVAFQMQFTDPCRSFPIETDSSNTHILHEIDSSEAENTLSLTVSKSDFSNMRVVGQFNLGFILAVRPPTEVQNEDDLFIIDQHAADEKFNFEKLQRTVTLQSQRLVRPKVLELTAFEQEVILNNHDALTFNGFEVEAIPLPANQIDDEETTPQTQTFRLLTLPTSQQTTFALSDLEELVHLLSETGSISNEASIPRPTKVRKMLAMRACRSSIMVGKTLTTKQMSQVVTNMGGMEKPWNCPHGRPTMRHLARMGAWQGWREGDDMDELAHDDSESQRTARTDWSSWLQTTTASQSSQE
ncbi:DNA mismatch repair protein MutL [Dissoconium aciculare CBS 342.82]|uniref:DNA mismatch repair protein PMS1 n=1 Tax=Dissoconium aciculare CBS 342.82 TaxID=1314786 RepID=A0A6J3M5L1_9PEZI|nr:DNA mismatch repair protein MutL [Dissoconium aciculare CBS 342.82]KAF1823351.1 DNA mismatch repair protein MutL [Dissoconium aciculare CBS 342.82]